MLVRFVSGCSVVSVAIAIATVIMVTVARTFAMSNLYLMAVLWCLLPAAWGVWAMLTPTSWMPHRLPNWGALLGAIIGFTGAFIINVPARVLLQPMSTQQRMLGVLTAVVIYYLLWMLVRKVYRKLVIG